MTTYGNDVVRGPITAKSCPWALRHNTEKLEKSDLYEKLSVALGEGVSRRIGRSYLSVLQNTLKHKLALSLDEKQPGNALAVSDKSPQSPKT